MTICIKGVRKESMQREYGIKFKLISIHNVMLFFYIIVMVIGESNFMQYGFMNSFISCCKLALLFSSMMYLLFLKRNIEMPKDIWFILLIGINVITMIQNGLEINFILLFMMIITSSKCSMESIFKTFLIAFCVGCAIVFLSSAFNIISDEINIRYSADFLSNLFLHSNRYERHSFGFQFSNQVPFVIMTIYFVWIAWKQEYVKFYQHLIFEILNIYTFVCCGSRFVFIIIVGTNILYYWVKIRYNKVKNGELAKIEIFLIDSIFGIGTIISFLCVLFYQWIPKFMDIFFNFRLTNAFQAVKYYGFHLLGSGFDAGTFNGEMEIIVDNGYIMLFMQRGIILGCAIILFWTYITRTVAKNKNPYILIPIFMFAIENFVDYQVMSFHFIAFMCIVCHTDDELVKFTAHDKTNVKYLIAKEGTNS